MSKRFYDTEIWSRPWFRKLSPAEKTAWQYINANCDSVGVWIPDFDAAEFYIGEEIKWEHFSTACNGNIEVLEDGKWWLPDFCAFQYGPLKETSRPHQAYIKLLYKHDLLNLFKDSGKGYERVCEAYQRGYETPKEKEKEKEKEKDKGIPLPLPHNSKRFLKPTLEDVAIYCRERGGKVDAQKWLDYYESNGWRVGRNPMKDWKAAVRTWERNDFRRSDGKRDGAPTPDQIIIPDFSRGRNARKS